MYCDIEVYAAELAELFGSFEDCGVVDPWEDTTTQWQAARDCALAAAQEQRAFKLVTRRQGIDSMIARAYLGEEAESYALTELLHDSYQIPTIEARSCAALVDEPGCTVAPGEACLRCEGQGTLAEVCGAP